MAFINNKKILSVVKVTPAGFYPIGYFSFTVDANDHLIMSYVGDTAPAFSINANGHLIYSGDDILDLTLSQTTKHLYWNL